jgi:hypothetical protein
VDLASDAEPGVVADVNYAGFVFVAWLQRDDRGGLVLRGRRPMPGPPQPAPVTLADGLPVSARMGDLAVTEGDATVVWEQDGRVGSVTATGEVAGEPRWLASGGASAPRIAADGGGSAGVVWQRRLADGSTVAELSRQVPEQPFGPPERLGAGSVPDVAFDRRGGFTAAWRDPRGAVAVVGGPVVEPLVGPVTIGGPGGSGPPVVLGDAQASFTIAATGADRRLWSATKRPGHAWGAPEAVGGSHPDAYAAAPISAGAAVAVWRSGDRVGAALRLWRSGAGNSPLLIPRT